MIDTLRTLRRPAPGAAWRALALYVGPALLLAGTVLPTALLLGRLPSHEVPPYQEHPLRYLVAAEVLGGWLVAGWATVLVVAATSRPPRPRLWETWVPLLYALGGLTIAFTVPPILLNLDRPYGVPYDAGAALRLPLTYAFSGACAGVGLVLGRRAAATEPGPRAAARAVWISRVDAGRSWWLAQLAFALGLSLLVAVPFVQAALWGAAVQTAGTVLGVSVAILAWGSRGQVSITPAGVRVRVGHVPVLGWELRIDQIASVEVANLRLLRSPAALLLPTRLALRDGPALVVRTTWGTRRWVTVPDAEDAAAVLRTWLAQRGASA
jgi:hypothetical protein